MQRVFLVGDEPIPGYKLLEDKGGTAFYKMWKVRSPQGATVLWKVIDMVVGNAAVETRTLGLLVTLRNPYLNTLSNFWQLDDGKTLILESEVPTGSLRDRLAQVRQNGQPGIPFDELIGYVEQAASGLDFLNSPQHMFQGQKVAVHHRSLRPECLLLFNDAGGKTSCKVSDFGLSKPVTEEAAQHSQGLIHYDYDPPEFFEGQTLQVSDQYSLAINYYELRTGSLPFSGTMLEQLQARLNDQPDLSLVEEPERSVVRKALSKEPALRFENCQAFAAALRSNTAMGAGRPAPTPPRAGLDSSRQAASSIGARQQPAFGSPQQQPPKQAHARPQGPPAFGTPSGQPQQQPNQPAAQQRRPLEDVGGKRFGSDAAPTQAKPAENKPTPAAATDVRSLRQQATRPQQGRNSGSGGGGGGKIPMTVVLLILIAFAAVGLGIAYLMGVFS